MSGRLVKLDRTLLDVLMCDSVQRGILGRDNLGWLRQKVQAGWDGVARSDETLRATLVLCQCGVMQLLHEAHGVLHRRWEWPHCPMCQRGYWDDEFSRALPVLVATGWDVAFEAMLSQQEGVLVYPVMYIREHPKLPKTVANG